MSPNPRASALAALIRIDEGSYANLVLGPMLASSKLDKRDRAFVTELVYGTTRMQRACDYLIEPFLLRPVDPQTRALLRLGTYQLHFMKVPAHAAVSATVAVSARRTKGLANAVLRRVAEATFSPPNLAIELSYPDWIVELMTKDLGPDEARAALMQMNESASMTQRDDGYVQDLGSQWVGDALGARAGDLVLDVCAAPGGKATSIARSGAFVVASDIRAHRAGLIAQNLASLGSASLDGESNANLAVVVADGRRPPWREASFDRILVDAPCSGLGVLRRRPDSRWRLQPDDIDRLAALQRELLVSAIPLLRPGGTLLFSVCTLTNAETIEIDTWLSDTYPEMKPLPSLDRPWQPHGRGSLLLPQSEGTDGMFCLSLIRSEQKDLIGR